MYFPQLPELADFAKAVPDLSIILNHIGGLLRTGPYANKDDEVLAAWRRGIAAVAACPNVTIKLGGIGMPRTTLVGVGHLIFFTDPDLVPCSTYGATKRAAVMFP